MKTLPSSSFLRFTLLAVCMTLLGACVESTYDSDPYGYGSSYYGGYDGHDYYERDRYEYERNRARRERKELEKERKRAEEERERLEEERRRRHREETRPTPRPVEHCPPGFSPSENKCSKEERKRGCKDMRLPGGLGCVSR